MRQIRGSDLPPFYFQLANDPQLLEAFKTVFVACNRGELVIPAKYRELMIMILGCARGVETTITVHGSKALEEGASIEEVGGGAAHRPDDLRHIGGPARGTSVRHAGVR